MIKINNVSKSFGKTNVLDNLNLTIEKGSIFGLIGINGAGKSTLLRILSGVYNSCGGNVYYDDLLLDDKNKKNINIFFLPDEPYYSYKVTPLDLMNIYKSYYNFDINVFFKNLEHFKLNKNESIYKFSKGMKRQVFISLAIASRPDYLFLDEAFDGLDPIARLYFKRELIKLVEELNTTVIISSHALRELEDICDSYGIIDSNKIISSGNINNSLEKMYKYQLAFDKELKELKLNDVEIINISREGRVIKVSFKGDRNKFLKEIELLKPILIDEIKINFEDLFVEEVSKRGYL